MNMDPNEDKKKIFSDAVNSRNPDNIAGMLSGMSDDDFRDAGEELWEEAGKAADDSSADEAFRSFMARTGRSHRIRMAAIGFCTVGIAAAIAAFIGFWAGTSKASMQVPETPVAAVWAEHCTKYGQKDSLVLPDGSKVWLNAGSRLLCPDRFTGAEREIFLSGEIYIEVAKDTLHPFIVNAGGMEVWVTGTKFNVKAYAEDRLAVTTLMEGGVTVSVPGQDSTVVLVPGNSLAYDRKSETCELYSVDLDTYPSWHDGEYSAYHLTLEDIARDLERRFGVEIVIRNPEIAGEMFYASFVNGEDADRILSALNIDGEFTIKRAGDVIDIY